MFRYVLTAALALSAAPALANDSIAELGTGGLILSRSDASDDSGPGNSGNGG